MKYINISNHSELSFVTTVHNRDKGTVHQIIKILSLTHPCDLIIYVGNTKRC